MISVFKKELTLLCNHVGIGVSCEKRDMVVSDTVITSNVVNLSSVVLVTFILENSFCV